MTPLPKPLARLVDALDAGRPADAKQAATLVSEAGACAEALAPWADYDHDPRHCYGRRLVMAGDGFELLVMSWRPGDASAIHDHGRARWGAIQVFGPAVHRVYRADAATVREVSSERLAPGRVLRIGPALIHQMVSPACLDAPWLSLHLYGGDPGASPVTGDTRLYDPAEGVVRHTDGGAFLAPLAEHFGAIERGPVGDAALVARFRAETRARLAAAID